MACYCAPIHFAWSPSTVKLSPGKSTSYQNPMHATMLGDYRFNDLLKDMTEEAHDENMHKYASAI
jgi:hypothetical protein